MSYTHDQCTAEWARLGYISPPIDNHTTTILRDTHGATLDQTIDIGSDVACGWTLDEAIEANITNTNTNTNINHDSGVTQ